MTMDSEYQKLLKQTDFSYFDKLLAKAKQNNEKTFSIPIQHFDNHREARSTCHEWEWQTPEIASFEFDTLNIIFHIH